MCTGSRIENSDGTCKSTGGFTTGTDGAAQGMARARSTVAGQEVAVTGTRAAASPASGAQPDVDMGLVLSSSAAALSVPAGLAELSGLTRVGSNGQLYLQTATGRVFLGNQYVTTVSLAKIGKFAGSGAAYVTLVVDAHSLSTGKIGWGKVAADATIIGASALIGGPFGVGLSVGYFGGDSFLQIRDQNRSVMDEWCAQDGNSC